MSTDRNRPLLVSGILLASILASPINAQTSSVLDSHGVGSLPPANSGGRPNAAALPDASFYTTYSFPTNYNTLHWTVCRSITQSTTCYGNGNLGPFGHVGAAVEGKPVASGNTVTRAIYVVDDAVSGGSGVTLYVYTKTDEVTSTGDVVSVNLAHTVALPLAGGMNAKTYIAGDDGSLYIMTNKTNGFVQMDESSLAYGLIGGFTPPAGGTSITTNRYGYVTATSYSYPFAGFYTMNPTDGYAEDGGGADFMLDTSNGISTGNGNFISYPIQANSATSPTHERKQPRQAGLSGNPTASTIVPQFDAGFFTTYTFWYSYTQLNWVTCGYFVNGDGCYGSGKLGPFGHIGAAVEGNEVVDGNAVTRKIYVVGDAEGNGSGVTLYVYTKTDTYSFSGGDKVAVNLTQTIPLPLMGGSQAKTFVVGDNEFLYIGTNQGSSVVQVQKPNLAYKSLTSSSSSKVSSITTNAHGFVTISYNDSTGAEYGIYDLTGSLVSYVAGDDFMLGASNGISTSDNNYTSTAAYVDPAVRIKTRFNIALPASTATH